MLNYTDAQLLYDLINEADKLDLVVNNIFEVTATLWQANLRDAQNMQFHAYGQGRTPGEAMTNAMNDARPQAIKLKAQRSKLKVTFDDDIFN